MDNATRSARSRSAVIAAALAIIARDGASRLTLDAIAREAGLSKGGLMHQFPTKRAVVEALLEHQSQYFEKFSQNYCAEMEAGTREPELLSQIAVMREHVARPRSVAFAILGAVAEDPALLSAFRKIDAKRIEQIKSDAADPQLATLRWAAARGLALTAMLGMCPLSKQEREHLFDRLLDNDKWQTPPATVAGGQRNSRGR